MAALLAGRSWFPIWGVMHHVGRRSRTAYAIPVAIIPTRGDHTFLIGLPWGVQTNWVRNVQAAGHATVTWKGREHVATDPLVITTEEAAALTTGPLRRVVASGRFPAFLRLTRSLPTSPEDNKQVVARFVERCQNQHDLDYADEAFHPDFVDHYAASDPVPAGEPAPPAAEPAAPPAAAFQAFYGLLLAGFPDATMQIDEQLAERDLVATRKTFRGTHRGELWGLAPTGRRVEWAFMDIFRIRDGKLAEHWASIDLEALRQQIGPRQ